MKDYLTGVGLAFSIFTVVVLMAAFGHIVTAQEAPTSSFTLQACWDWGAITNTCKPAPEGDLDTRQLCERTMTGAVPDENGNSPAALCLGAGCEQLFQAAGIPSRTATVVMRGITTRYCGIVIE